MTSALIDWFSSADHLGPSEHPLGELDRLLRPVIMSDDEMEVSMPDTPDDVEMSDEERQRITTSTYLNALPYACETEQEMHEKLEYIVGRLVICAETRDWTTLGTWDGILQWCVNLKEGI
jgi:hypothetical protein